MKNSRLILVTCCLANFFAGTFYSLMAPFFAVEAKKKGANATVAGMIIAIYQLACMLVTPVFGYYLTTFGAKLTFVSGLVVGGSGIIGFGCLDAVPSGATYIVMCIVIRCVDACGSCAFCTASLAILANEFPNNVSTIFAVLEVFTGIGLLIGPALGELLYEAGGFRLPFVSCGAAILAVGGLAWLLLPPQIEITQKERKSLWSFVTILPVLLIGFISIVLYSVIGLLEIALAIHVNTNYNVSPVLFTAVFLTFGGLYAFSSPIWGLIADRKPQWGPALVTVGSLTRSVALLLMGPASFLHIPNHPLWLLYVSLVLAGTGLGNVVVCTQQLFNIATKHGYPDNLDTKGLVSGVFFFFTYTGLFLGPIVGGYFTETLGFEWTAAIISFTGLFASSLWLVYISTSSCRAEKTDENHPILLSNPTD